ncbi:hypothetical protein HPG69_002860 [Diceros bicornis minor]|uniref:G-protein coupled receptors family 3 profile domain-containing protein n=1 Tax=Diceros bicornis minor TaxID=77932 RepID=A0A7J7ER24_DICBM|nr:hypothetical protein HPG69_002860 [Diceros bicornis minor]
MQFNNNAVDQVYLDQQRISVKQYDILNFWYFLDGFGLQVKVGQFVPQAPHGQDFSIYEELIDWATESKEGLAPFMTQNITYTEKKMGKKSRSILIKYPNILFLKEQEYLSGCDLLAYDNLMGMEIACAAPCLSVLTAVFRRIFVKYRETPIVKANNRALNYILLTSLILDLVCPLFFIGHPKTATSILQQMTFGVMFTVAVSTILAKTITIVLAFKITTPRRKMRQCLLSRAPNSIVPICSLIQVTFCAVCLGTSPFLLT